MKGLYNNDSAYGLVTRANHWLSAILVIGLIGLGIYMTGLPDSPDKFELYDVHKALGIGVLGLIILRLIWLKLSPNPPILPAKRWEEVLAHSVRGLLYLSLLIMPFSGWAMSSAGGHEVSFFGLFTLPALVPESEAIGDVAKTVHAFVGNILFPALILLHIAGALKHHFIYKDNTLKRMLGRD
ncbi:cytochrome b [Thiomicrospira sp. WB1]|uniref:cytochrome b n=1 Tax=Thiomicrospira sp. WB1 TaxID=1685380 RepID=UPI00074682B7|nr:cytochrome b [Thiomicrospira sp. WB1]KUJ72514.1 cytochrome B [Thiomicrospira sp. WB1]